MVVKSVEWLVVDLVERKDRKLVVKRAENWVGLKVALMVNK